MPSINGPNNDEIFSVLKTQTKFLATDVMLGKCLSLPNVMFIGFCTINELPPWFVRLEQPQPQEMQLVKHYVKVTYLLVHSKLDEINAILKMLTNCYR